MSFCVRDHTRFVLRMICVMNACCEIRRAHSWAVCILRPTEKIANSKTILVFIISCCDVFNYTRTESIIMQYIRFNISYIHSFAGSDVFKKQMPRMEATHVMEVAQLLLSLIHSWGLDPHLDKVCESQLGLLRPMIPVSFGVLSKAGYMSLLLPTWQNDLIVDTTLITPASATASTTPDMLRLERSLPPELIRQENLTRLFTHRLHWELSTTLTSNHLLAMVAMSNTLMSMTMATFVPEHERNKKLQRQSTRVNASWTNEEHEEMYTQQQAQIKQGWSLLSTHHCFLLPDKIDALGE